MIHIFLLLHNRGGGRMDRNPCDPELANTAASPTLESASLWQLLGRRVKDASQEGACSETQSFLQGQSGCWNGMLQSIHRLLKCRICGFSFCPVSLQKYPDLWSPETKHHQSSLHWEVEWPHLSPTFVNESVGFVIYGFFKGAVDGALWSHWYKKRIPIYARTHAYPHMRANTHIPTQTCVHTPLCPEWGGGKRESDPILHKDESKCSFYRWHCLHHFQLCMRAKRSFSSVRILWTIPTQLVKPDS